jgi:hypothetical protein
MRPRVAAGNARAFPDGWTSTEGCLSSHSRSSYQEKARRRASDVVSGQALLGCGTGLPQTE